MDSKKQKNIEETSNEYKFVRETIIDRKTRIKREFFRLVTNFFFIIVVCVATCIIFVQLSMQQENDNVDESSTMYEVESGIDDVVQETTTGELTQEEIENRKYISGIVSFTGLIKEEEPVEMLSDRENKTTGETVRLVSTGKTDEMISENTRKFIGAIIAKSPYLVAITSANNVENLGVIYADINGRKGLTVEVIYIDNELGIAYLSINKNLISYSELEKISLLNIAKNAEPIVGKKIKFCGMIQGAGMSVIDGKILSNGEEEIIIDTVLRKYLVDISMSGVSEGFLFDDSGSLTAITAIDKEEDSKIKVLDLSNIKSRILSAAELELVISFGIKGQKVTADIEELVGKNLPDGMYVTYVEVDSPAYRAGIMVGDIIYRINTYTISDLNDVRIVIDSKKVGDVISTYLFRNMGTKYNTYTLSVELSHKNKNDYK